MSKSILQSMATTGDPAAALKDYLRKALVESDDDQQVLDLLMSHFRNIEDDDYPGFAAFTYVDYKDIIVPLTIDEPDTMITDVASLKKVCETYGGMDATCYGGGGITFPGRNDVEDFLFNAEDFPDEPEIVFDVGQNIMIAHPTDKNSLGEPVLYFIDHEDGIARKLEGADKFTAMQVYLRLVVQHLGLATYFDDVSD